MYKQLETIQFRDPSPIQPIFRCVVFHTLERNEDSMLCMKDPEWTVIILNGYTHKRNSSIL